MFFLVENPPIWAQGQDKDTKIKSYNVHVRFAEARNFFHSHRDEWYHDELKITY